MNDNTVELNLTYQISNNQSQIFKLIVRNKSPLDLYTHYADSQFVQKSMNNFIEAHICYT